jgi:hypothetical protein
LKHAYNILISIIVLPYYDADYLMTLHHLQSYSILNKIKEWSYSIKHEKILAEGDQAYFKVLPGIIQ